MLHGTRDLLRVGELKCRGLDPSVGRLKCTLVLLDEGGKEGEKARTPTCMSMGETRSWGAWEQIFGEQLPAFPLAQSLQIKVKTPAGDNVGRVTVSFDHLTAVAAVAAAHKASVTVSGSASHAGAASLAEASAAAPPASSAVTDVVDARWHALDSSTQGEVQREVHVSLELLRGAVGGNIADVAEQPGGEAATAADGANSKRASLVGDVIMRGELSKKRKSMASFFWHKRFFELRRDGRFCWFKREGAPCLGAIALAAGALVQRSSKVENPAGFSVHDCNGAKVRLRAASVAERERWVVAISSQLEAIAIETGHLSRPQLGFKRRKHWQTSREVVIARTGGFKVIMQHHTFDVQAEHPVDSAALLRATATDPERSLPLTASRITPPDQASGEAGGGSKAAADSAASGATVLQLALGLSFRLPVVTTNRRSLSGRAPSFDRGGASERGRITVATAVPTAIAPRAPVLGRQQSARGDEPKQERALFVVLLASKPFRSDGRDWATAHQGSRLNLLSSLYAGARASEAGAAAVASADAAMAPQEAGRTEYEAYHCPDGGSGNFATPFSIAFATVLRIDCPPQHDRRLRAELRQLRDTSAGISGGFSTLATVELGALRTLLAGRLGAPGSERSRSRSIGARGPGGVVTLSAEMKCVPGTGTANWPPRALACYLDLQAEPVRAGHRYLCRGLGLTRPISADNQAFRLPRAPVVAAAGAGMVVKETALATAAAARDVVVERGRDDGELCASAAESVSASSSRMTAEGCSDDEFYTHAEEECAEADMNASTSLEVREELLTSALGFVVPALYFRLRGQEMRAKEDRGKSSPPSDGEDGSPQEAREFGAETPAATARRSETAVVGSGREPVLQQMGGDPLRITATAPSQAAEAMRVKAARGSASGGQMARSRGGRGSMSGRVYGSGHAFALSHLYVALAAAAEGQRRQVAGLGGQPELAGVEVCMTFKPSSKKDDWGLRGAPCNLGVHLLHVRRRGADSRDDADTTDTTTDTTYGLVTVGAFAAHALKFEQHRRRLESVATTAAAVAASRGGMVGHPSCDDADDDALPTRQRAESNHLIKTLEPSRTSFATERKVDRNRGGSVSMGYEIPATGDDQRGREQRDALREARPPAASSSGTAIPAGFAAPSRGSIVPRSSQTDSGRLAAAAASAAAAEYAEISGTAEWLHRHDTVVSQALAALVASFVMTLELGMAQPGSAIARSLARLGRTGFLWQLECLLSVVGNERGMLEDTVHAVEQLRGVTLVLVRRDEGEGGRAAAGEVEGGGSGAETRRIEVAGSAVLLRMVRRLGSADEDGAEAADGAAAGIPEDDEDTFDDDAAAAAKEAGIDIELQLSPEVYDRLPPQLQRAGAEASAGAGTRITVVPLMFTQVRARVLAGWLAVQATTMKKGR